MHGFKGNNNTMWWHFQFTKEKIQYNILCIKSDLMVFKLTIEKHMQTYWDEIPTSMKLSALELAIHFFGLPFAKFRIKVACTKT